MLNKRKDEELLSDVMNLFNPLRIEVSPNYPIANADDSLNEALVRQIEIEIQQTIARLSDGSIRFFEDTSQLAGLITSSGGHKKSLYILIHDTALYSEVLPVQQRAIGKARGGLKYILNNSVDECQWDLLAKVHRDPFCAYSQIEQYATLLKWSVLKYEDAGLGIEWYRVHPLLVEVQRFRRAIEDFR